MGRRRRVRGTRKVQCSDEQRKAKLISQCLDADPVNLPLLRRLAVSPGGLLNNDIRYRAWPKLLDLNIYNAPQYKDYVKENKDSDQIERDVDRSLWHFTCDKQLSDERRAAERVTLSGMINAMVVRNPELNYYQGYHDVVTVFLRVMGEQRAFQMVERCSLHHFRECMNKDFEQVLPVLKLLFPLINTEDQAVADFLKESEVEPFFALPWLITWFAHNFEDIDQVSRVYDACLASHPMFPLYFCAAAVLHRRDELLNEVECDFSMVHNFLAKLPQSTPVEQLIARATDIHRKCPPGQLIKLSNQPFPSPSEYLTWTWIDPTAVRSNSHLWAEARGGAQAKHRGKRRKKGKANQSRVIVSRKKPEEANNNNINPRAVFALSGSLLLCLMARVVYYHAQTPL